MWPVLEVAVVMFGIIAVASIVCYTIRAHYREEQAKPLKLKQMENNAALEKAMMIERIYDKQIEAQKEGREPPLLPRI